MKIRREREALAAWSLIEILVVVAILAILIALIVPASKLWLSSAHSAGSVNNLRQLGVAMASYVAENNMKCPPNTGANGTWDTHIGKYLGENIESVPGFPAAPTGTLSKVFAAPGDRVKRYQGNDAFKRSYTMVYMLGFDFWEVNWYPWDAEINVTRIVKPGTKPLLWEWFNFANVRGWAQRAGSAREPMFLGTLAAKDKGADLYNDAMWQRGTNNPGVNVLYWDYSVRWTKASDMLGNAPDQRYPGEEIWVFDCDGTQ